MYAPTREGELVLLLSFAKRVKAPGHVLMRELSGESVLLNLNSECYFGLNEVGTCIWTALTTSDSVQAAYEALLAVYDVETERLRRDLHEVIETLLEHGLVEVSGG